MAEIVRTVQLTFNDGSVRAVLMNNAAKVDAECALRQADGNPTPFYQLMNMDGLAPLRALLWAGMRGALLAENRRAEANVLTLEAAGELLDEIDNNELAAWLVVAVVAADKRTTEDQLKNVREVTIKRIATWKAEEQNLENSDALPSDPAV